MSEEIKTELDPKDARIAELEARVKELEETEHICKRCGRSNMEQELRIKDEVLHEYFRSILGQRPFTYTLTALEGAMNVEFTLQRGDTLLASLANDQLQDIGGTATATMIMMSTLSGVVLNDKQRGVSKAVYTADAETLTKAADNYKEYYDKLVKSIDAVQLSVIRQASALFNLLTMELMKAVVSKDFYEGAGLI